MPILCRLPVLIALWGCLQFGGLALETGAPPDGDFNRDGAVDAADELRLAWFLAGITANRTACLGWGDMDSDGGADAVDLVLLRLRARALPVTLCVDDGNGSASQNGTALRPYRTIQAALDAAPGGCTIKVAAGEYVESVSIAAGGKTLRLVGGFAGGSPADYAAGTGGDFGSRSLDPAVTVIRGIDRTRPVLDVTRDTEAPMSLVVDNFRITGSSRGVFLNADISWPHVENVTLSHNLIEDNGDPAAPDDGVNGVGIGVSGTGISILDNVIRDNHGGRGAGIGLVATPTNLLVRGNLVEDNHCHSDHGGGISLDGTVTLMENVIRGNRVELDYGWGGGVLLFGSCQVTMTGNRVEGNHAPGIGGGVFVDEGGTAVLDHELIVGNTTSAPDKGGAGVYVDGGWDWVNDVPLSSTAVLINCTVAGNTSPGVNGGNGVYVEYASSAEIVDSIFWGNGDDFYLREDGLALVATYTLSHENLAGEGNLSADPLFADPAAGDYHLRSAAGRWDPATNGGDGGWVVDVVTSPAIDRAGLSAPFSLEPIPNGGRANLGAYGNTRQASRSPQLEKDHE